MALGKLSEFDPATSFTAWMSQIVRYVALNAGRKHAREQSTRAGEIALETAPARVADAADSSGRATFSDDRLNAALAQLDDVARMCLIMKTTADISYKEIAAALGIPEGTAMSHVFRARKVLRERLSDPDSRGEGSR